MVTPVPLPVIVFPRFPDWLPFSQPVKVPSSNPALGKESAWALEDTPRIDIRANETTDTIGNSRRNEKFKTCPSLNFGTDIMTQRVLVGLKKLM